MHVQFLVQAAETPKARFPGPSASPGGWMDGSGNLGEVPRAADEAQQQRGGDHQDAGQRVGFFGKHETSPLKAGIEADAANAMLRIYPAPEGDIGFKKVSFTRISPRLIGLVIVKNPDSAQRM